MKILPIVACASLLPTICLAQSDREQDAHDHGAGSLNIAIDDTSVYIEFDAPWDNLVGFEHTPSNSEQSGLVDAALANLQSPDELFGFNGANCTMNTVDIENSMAQSDENQGKAHKEEHEEEHEEEHKEEHEEEHEDHSEQHDAKENNDSHSAVFAEYKFDCGDTSSLTSIDLAIFSVWQRFDELDVQVIGPQGAISIELTAGSANLDLAAVN